MTFLGRVIPNGKSQTLSSWYSTLANTLTFSKASAKPLAPMIQKDTVPQTHQENISLQNITEHNRYMSDFCPIIQIDKHMSYYRG